MRSGKISMFDCLWKLPIICMANSSNFYMTTIKVPYNYLVSVCTYTYTKGNSVLLITVEFVKEVMVSWCLFALVVYVAFAVAVCTLLLSWMAFSFGQSCMEESTCTLNNALGNFSADCHGVVMDYVYCLKEKNCSDIESTIKNTTKFTYPEQCVFSQANFNCK